MDRLARGSTFTGGVPVVGSSLIRLIFKRGPAPDADRRSDQTPVVGDHLRFLGPAIRCRARQGDPRLLDPKRVIASGAPLLGHVDPEALQTTSGAAIASRGDGPARGFASRLVLPSDLGLCLVGGPSRAAPGSPLLLPLGDGGDVNERKTWTERRQSRRRWRATQGGSHKEATARAQAIPPSLLRSSIRSSHQVAGTALLPYSTRVGRWVGAAAPGFIVRVPPLAPDPLLPFRLVSRCNSRY